MSIELRPGDPVWFSDYYGMTGYDGTYMGIYRDTANMICEDIVVVRFRPAWQDAPPIRYAGCVPQTHVGKGYDGKPDAFGVSFIAHYYGDTIETLKHVSREQRPRQWEKR